MHVDDDTLRLHEIIEQNRLRAYGRILEDLRLPPERLPALREVFDRFARQLHYEIRVQVGTIMADHFEFESLDAHVQELALAIGRLVNGERGSESLRAAKESTRTMLGALAAGAKIAATDPASGAAVCEAFGGVLERDQEEES